MPIFLKYTHRKVLLFFFCRSADESSLTITERTNRYLSDMLVPPLIHLRTRIRKRTEITRVADPREKQHFRTCPNGLSRTLFCQVWTHEGVNWVAATTSKNLASFRSVGKKKFAFAKSRVEDNHVRTSRECLLSSSHLTLDK